MGRTVILRERLGPRILVNGFFKSLFLNPLAEVFSEVAIALSDEFLVVDFGEEIHAAGAKFSDRHGVGLEFDVKEESVPAWSTCLLYTSDAADE